jgi:hypothetical protein
MRDVKLRIYAIKNALQIDAGDNAPRQTGRAGKNDNRGTKPVLNKALRIDSEDSNIVVVHVQKK